MDDTSPRGPARHPDGRFGPGNPGRVLGSRNRMSNRIAVNLLRHYAGHEAEILNRLSQNYLTDYVRLVGRLLPRGCDDAAAHIEQLFSQDPTEVTRAVRGALDRIEAGEGSLAEIEAALAGVGSEPGDRSLR